MEAIQCLRNSYHDYCKRSRYMITLFKSHDCEPFGESCGDVNVPPGSSGGVEIRLSATGEAVVAALGVFHLRYPDIKLYKYVITPGHVQLLVGLDEYDGCSMVAYIDELIALCGDMVMPYFADIVIGEDQPLNPFVNYIRERLWRDKLLHERPELFTRVNMFRINRREYATYGNYMLLKNPAKEAVIIHRRDTLPQRKANVDRWLHMASGGGVLVSPFISPDEQAVRDRAEVIGGSIIWLRHTPLSDGFAPVAADVERCRSGRLLIVAPVTSHGISLTREICLELNELAATIARVL